jgi:hypothetical protein
MLFGVPIIIRPVALRGLVGSNFIIIVVMVPVHSLLSRLTQIVCVWF